MLTSPLWGIVLAGVLLGAGPEFAQTPRELFILAQLPLLAALMAQGLALGRVRRGRMEEAWHLAGGPLHEMRRAIFGPPWILWAVVMIALSVLVLGRSWIEAVGRLLRGDLTLVVFTPGGAGFTLTSYSEAHAWVPRVYALAGGMGILALAL